MLHTDGVENKNVLVLDNLAITGANAQEAFDALRGAGAGFVGVPMSLFGTNGVRGKLDLPQRLMPFIAAVFEAGFGIPGKKSTSRGSSAFLSA